LISSEMKGDKSPRMSFTSHDMARHGANYASPCHLDRLRATKIARLGTPYCGGIIREQNSCQCEACLRLSDVTWNHS